MDENNLQQGKRDLKKWAIPTLRIGIALVFLWFGTNEIMNPSMWTSLIPHWVMSFTGLSATTFVYLNGFAEVVLGLMLAFNLYLRVVSFLLAVHLFMIVIDVGYDAIGVRDFGLFIATVSLFLSGF